MARPTKCTPELTEAIALRIEEGTVPETAAQLEGVSPTTYYRWMSEGRRGVDEARREFQERIARARAEAERAMVEEIRSAVTQQGAPDWKARAWLLERTQPERFGQTVQVRAKVDSELKDAIERLRAELDPATFRRVAEALASGGSDGSGVGEPGPTDDRGAD